MMTGDKVSQSGLHTKYNIWHTRVAIQSVVHPLLCLFINMFFVSAVVVPDISLIKTQGWFLVIKLLFFDMQLICLNNTLRASSDIIKSTNTNNRLRSSSKMSKNTTKILAKMF